MDFTRWSILKLFFAAKMEKFYTVGGKKVRELTVAQTVNSLLPNSDLN